MRWPIPTECRRSRWLAFAILGLMALAVSRAEDSQDRTQWPELRREHRPGTYWWWMGSAVDREGLTRDLERLKDAGFGGVHVIPIYGVKGEEDRYLEFLSAEWVERLRHVLAEADRLDLWVDMTTGTGWPFGGPGVERDDAEQLLERGRDGVTPRRMPDLMPERALVERAAPGGVGWVINPFEEAAMRRYLVRFDEALDDLGPHPLRAQYHDSYEYFGNWAPSLPEVFRQLNGYDVRPWLERLSVISPDAPADTVARVKRDYRRTLASMHRTAMQRWVEWCHDHGWAARNQAHGPRQQANWLDVYALADIPETESALAYPVSIPGIRQEPRFAWPAAPGRVFGNRMASSAAHVVGRRVVASETFTWIGEHFHTPLAMLKPEVDLLFTAGINQILFHGHAYSPAGEAWPGWLFYASFQANERNPLWRDLPALNHYIARVQSVLQSGEPDNDLLMYLPIDDVWQDPSPPPVDPEADDPDPYRWLKTDLDGRLSRNGFYDNVARLTQAGYTCDYASDAMVQSLRWRDGRLTAGGASYRAILVPGARLMRTETLRALRRLAEAGASVVFSGDLPRDVPGWGELAARRRAFAAQMDGIHFSREGAGSVEVARVGAGRFLRGHDLLELAAAAGLPREDLADRGLAFCRRRTVDGADYFVTNLTAGAVDAWFQLSAPGEHVWIMDPQTDREGKAAVRYREGRREVRLALAAGSSLILKSSVRSFGDERRWPYWRETGGPIPLEGPWRIRFVAGGPGVPGAATLRRLGSWTTLPDAEAQRFAGTACYTAEVELPPGTANERWLLDLGDVRESARVRVNGESAGTVWSPPFAVEIGRLLQPGRNRIEVEVTNLAANRVRDLDRRGVDWKRFHDINFVSLDYEPFDASDWPVAASGLLGPVKLVPVGDQERASSRN